MGKTKEQKYTEAVERNLKAKHKSLSDWLATVSIEKARHHFGIRKDDTRYDYRIEILCGK